MDSQGQLWFPANSGAPWFYSCKRNRYNSAFTSASLPSWRKLQLDHPPSHLCLYHWIVLVPFLWIPFSVSLSFFFYYWGKSCTRFSSLNLPANPLSPSAYFFLFSTLGKIPVLSSLQEPGPDSLSNTSCGIKVKPVILLLDIVPSCSFWLWKD